MTDTRRLTGHLPTLDGWRGVAVLMVIVFHAIGWKNPAFKPLGGLGVSIFFALSGLLICNRLLAEHGRTGRIDLRGFYIRRAFRGRRRHVVGYRPGERAMSDARDLDLNDLITSSPEILGGARVFRGTRVPVP